jgi:hypothetical protein
VLYILLIFSCRTPRRGHQEEDTKKRTPRRGHQEEGAKKRTPRRGRQEEDAKKRTPSRGPRRGRHTEEDAEMLSCKYPLHLISNFFTLLMTLFHLII